MIVGNLFAAEAVIALENANLYAQLERTISEQKALQESTLMISSTLDLNEILSKIAEQIGVLVNATSVYISAYDPVNQTSQGLVEYMGPDANELEKESDLGVVYDHSEEYADLRHMFDSGEPYSYSLDQ